MRKVVVYSRLADLEEEGRQETFHSIDFRAPLRKTAMDRWSAEKSGMVYGMVVDGPGRKCYQLSKDESQK